MNKKITVFLLSSTLTLGGLSTAFSPIDVEASSSKEVPKHQHSVYDGKKFDKKDQLDKDSKDSILERGNLKKFKDAYTEVEGHSIHYKIYNDNKKTDKTYIISHGATATLETTKIYASALAEKQPNAKIILVNLPIHGKSTSETFMIEDISIDAYAEIMKAFIDKKRADKTIQGELNWSGWSMGGSIGLQLDLMGAGFEELTLINSGPYWAPIGGLAASMGFEKYSPEITAAIMAGNYQTEFAYGLSDKDKVSLLAELDKFSSLSEVGAADFNAILPSVFDLRDQLSNVKAKTLILSGTNDALVELQYQELMDEKIVDSKFVLLEDGHAMLMKPVLAKQMVEEVDSFFGNGKKNKGD